jgi:mono/diheme cytochrome c family protein
MKTIHLALSAMLSLAATNVYADTVTAQKLADKYAAAAKKADSSYAGLSVDEGKAFFNREVIQFKGDVNNPGKAIACASCHTANPADTGKHIVTGKSIKPLSPAVNAKRFSSVKNVEKKFTEHCNEVVGSDCTAQEKGDYIAYLLTEKTPTKK